MSQRVYWNDRDGGRYEEINTDKGETIKKIGRYGNKARYYFNLKAAVRNYINCNDPKLCRTANSRGGNRSNKEFSEGKVVSYKHIILRVPLFLD